MANLTLKVSEWKAWRKFSFRKCFLFCFCSVSTIGDTAIHLFASNMDSILLSCGCLPCVHHAHSTHCHQGWIFSKDSSQNMLAFFRNFWSKWVRKSNVWDFLKMSQDIKYLEIFILVYSFRYGIHDSYSCRRPIIYDQLCMQIPWHS